MTKLSFNEVQKTRFKPSLMAHKNSEFIEEFLGLDNRAAAVRLSIGFSLRFSGTVDAVQNSQGIEISGDTIFGKKPDEVNFWIALLCTYENNTKSDTEFTFDDFRKSVYFHWERGAKKLVDEIDKSGRNYTDFLGQLAEVANNDFVSQQGSSTAFKNTNTNQNGEVSTTNKENDIKDNILRELRDLGVKEIASIIQGPRITRYAIKLVHSSQYDQIRKRLGNIAVATGVSEELIDISHEQMVVNIDIPREDKSWKTYGLEHFKKWLSEDHKSDGHLNLYLGVDMLETPYKFDLLTSPHLLIAGSTGGGKSTCLHSIICSLIQKKSPEQLKLALIDPKQTELSDYRNSKHLFKGEIATQIDAIEDLLRDVIDEMESRNSLFADINVRGIVEATNAGELLPYIVVVIDELANLFIDSNLRERFEPLISKLATMGRTAGIHLIGCTQRPDAKTIDGQIRQNLTSKIALKVNKKSESVIIMEEDGAEQLLGKGDMWVKWNGQLGKVRLQGVYLTTDDVNCLIR